MYSNLLLIFIAMKFLKSIFDERFGRIRLRYRESFVYLNELTFSLATEVGLILGFISALILQEPTYMLSVIGLSISILFIKVNQQWRTYGDRILYLLYTMCLLSCLQSQSHVINSIASSTGIGALIVLIPKPLQHIKTLLESLNKTENNNLLLYVSNFVSMLSDVVTMLFQGVFAPIFCFWYIRHVDDTCASICVYLITLISTMMVFIRNSSKHPELQTIIKDHFSDN